MINKLICEKPLPLPPPVEEDANGDFKDIVWDEHAFYTASFFDMHDDVFSSSTYTITEDGQFYKDSTEMEMEVDENGEVLTKEKNQGIERQDFTGEIYFGCEMLGEENDHTIDFKALFYKGELKELELDEYKEHSNKKRKDAMTEISNHYKKEINRRNSSWYLIMLPFKKFAFFVIKIIKWMMFRVFSLVVKIEIWATK